nr:hypothetical protein [Niallia taxi]
MARKELPPVLRGSSFLLSILGEKIMKLVGFVIAIISIIIVFFQYNLAVLLFGTALVFFGIDDHKSKNKSLSYIFMTAGFVFIIGILIKGL